MRLRHDNASPARLTRALLCVLLMAPLAGWSASPPSTGQVISSTPKSASKPPASGPTWAELSKTQQAALKPLASNWNTLSEAQKRKWIAVSANFGNMHADDQQRLHTRMTEWVALSPQQRAQARLNFAETKKLTSEEKKAKWDAYQALSPEEKQKLAAKAAASKPNGAAVAVRPVAPQKLVVVPAATSSTRHPAKISAEHGPATETPKHATTLAPAPVTPVPAPIQAPAP